jgi:hypothetical protein
MLSPLRSRAKRRLREPFGKAGLTVAVIALVFAMLGGAYAATGLNSKQKKEVKKIAKSFQGTGPAGAAGPAGAKGDTGAAGSNGQNGAPGKDGQGVTANPLAPGEGPEGEECEEGGVELISVSGVDVVCNGEEGAQGAQGATGAQGPEGSPWTAGGTLPGGSTETGSFYTITTKAVGPNFTGFAPISFLIPLAEALANTKVKVAKIPGAAASGKGDIETGSKLVKNTTASFTLGSQISGAGIPAGATVAKRISGTEFELSIAATETKEGAEAPTLTATPTPPPAECENGVHPGGAGPENPEATSGFLCVFLGASNPSGAFSTGPAPNAVIVKAGSPAASATGASTGGARLQILTAESGTEVSGTFAVTG